ncbi:MAG: GTP-binding protein, partial [Bacteroidota bacterium]
REQGITIDVAYRYFNTPKRKFIIADTPGHVQYTRNMVTGASTADAALILIDARIGVSEQTRRHAYIASLLGIPHQIICVNKMDLIDFSQERFEEIRRQFEALSHQLHSETTHFIPVSALLGDNVVNRSSNTPWYSGPPLLRLLESIELRKNTASAPARFPVQTVIRTENDPHYYGLAGSLVSGEFQKGDSIRIQPSGQMAKIEAIHQHGQEISRAHAPMSVVLSLSEPISVSRGDLVLHSEEALVPTNTHEAHLCWLNEQPGTTGKSYLLRHTTNEQTAVIEEVLYHVNVNELGPLAGKTQLDMNDICKIRFRSSAPLAADTYENNRHTGSFILIDQETKDTVAAGMISNSQIAGHHENFTHQIL